MCRCLVRSGCIGGKEKKRKEVCTDTYKNKERGALDMLVLHTCMHVHVLGFKTKTNRDFEKNQIEEINSQNRFKEHIIIC